MIQIIFISVIAGVIAILLIWRMYRLVSILLKNGEVNMKTNLASIGVLVLVFGGLVVYNIYLISSEIIDNKDKILGMGQKAISSTVNYGATAVFEGLGNTIEHFESKWDAKYAEQLKNVDIEIQSIERKKLNETSDSIHAQILFTNKNTSNEKLDLGNISNNNYILIGGKDSIYYPLIISNNQNYNYLPTGKTVLKVEGIVPQNLTIKYFRLLDSVKEAK